MCPLAQSRFDGIDFLHELLDHGQDRVANQFGLLPEFVPVNSVNAAMLYDLVCSLLGNDAETGLCDGERRLELQVVGCAGGVGPDGGALAGGEDVAEDEGVGDCCHCDCRRYHLWWSWWWLMQEAAFDERDVISERPFQLSNVTTHMDVACKIPILLISDREPTSLQLASSYEHNSTLNIIVQMASLNWGLCATVSG